MPIYLWWVWFKAVEKIVSPGGSLIWRLIVYFGFMRAGWESEVSVGDDETAALDRVGDAVNQIVMCCSDMPYIRWKKPSKYQIGLDGGKTMHFKTLQALLLSVGWYFLIFSLAQPSDSLRYVRLSSYIQIQQSSYT